MSLSNSMYDALVKTAAKYDTSNWMAEQIETSSQFVMCVSESFIGKYNEKELTKFLPYTANEEEYTCSYFNLKTFDNIVYLLSPKNDVFDLANAITKMYGPSSSMPKNASQYYEELEKELLDLGFQVEIRDANFLQSAFTKVLVILGKSDNFKRLRLAGSML